MDLFPARIVPFPEGFRNCFNAGGFRYFFGYMWVCTGLTGWRRLTCPAAGCPVIERHTSGWGRFFGESPLCRAGRYLPSLSWVTDTGDAWVQRPSASSPRCSCIRWLGGRLRSPSAGAVRIRRFQ